MMNVTEAPPTKPRFLIRDGETVLANVSESEAVELRNALNARLGDYGLEPTDLFATHGDLLDSHNLRDHPDNDARYRDHGSPRGGGARIWKMLLVRTRAGTQFNRRVYLGPIEPAEMSR